MYIFNLMDYQTAGLSLLFVTLMEIVVVGRIYGRLICKALTLKRLGSPSKVTIQFICIFLKPKRPFINF